VVSKQRLYIPIHFYSKKIDDQPNIGILIILILYISEHISILLYIKRS